MVLWIHIEVIDFSILLIFKYKQYKNANIANFIHYGKTRVYVNLCEVQVWHWYNTCMMYVQISDT